MTDLPESIRRPQHGFALLEALIAILIFSIGILSLVGMQATAARYATDAKFRSQAAYQASQCMADIRVASRAGMADACPDSTSVAGLPNSSRTVTIVGDAQQGYTVTVTINWKLPGETATHEQQMITNIHDRCDTVGCI